MSECDEKFASLKPMRIRYDSVESNVADFLQHQANQSEDHRRLIEIDGTISGIDVGGQLGVSSGSDVDIATAETDYNEALGRFMRNEIAYDEFMEITGGVGLNEEAADCDDAMVEDDPDEADLLAGSSRVNRHRDSTSANEALDDEEMDEDDEAGPSTSGLSSIMRPLGSVPALASSRRFKSERILLTNKNGEEVDEDRLLGIPLELRNRGPSADHLGGRSIIVKSETSVVQQRNKLSRTLDALLGQANVIYAKGQTKEALTMLLEVIRQEPRNPDAYRLVADIYKEMNQSHKSLQYGLLAAHLNSRTSAEEWVELGNLAYNLQRIEEAAACYGRAIRAEPSNWKHYEKRIETLELIGLRPVAMRTRLMAAQNIDHSSAQVDFDWFEALIKSVAEYYIQMNDEEKAILALEAFVLRSREFGRKADSQHQTLVGMWMVRQRFEDAAKSIFALCQGITALDANGKFAMEIKFNNAGYTVKPFPPRKVHRFVVGNSLSSMMLIRVIVCFIRLGRKDLVPTLVDKLFERDILPEDEPLYLDIARAYQAVECIPHAQKYVEHLLARHCFSESPDVWFLYGQLLSARKKTEEATHAYERVLDIQPSHVDARINLSTLQQRMGMAEKAFETLRDYDLDAGSSLPDERLLIRQADFLSQHKRIDQFVRCVRMLLTPHFYVVHQNSSLLKKRAVAGSVVALCNGLRAAAFNAVHGSPLEKYVKRLGAIAANEDRPPSDMTAIQLHDYTFKLLEILLSQGRYADALHVCCYSYLQPLICKSPKTVETFHNLLMFCAMKAHYWPLAFEYLRWFHTSTLASNHSPLVPAERDLLFTRIFNAMNHVFCHSQNVSYHRYVMRALARMPGNIALQMISGNNSLITGAYRHALGEYLRVWFQVPDNPLVCLLLALTFTHMACKKDISSRHMVALRGLAFMNRYQRIRGDCQETNFNIARMFHQMNILPLAIHFYQKCLDSKVPMVAVVDEDSGEETIVPYERYDLRPSAAHNLAIIYETSGNILLARQILLKYCTIE
uniref:General transcription factor 3C polypeptide 3 n=1 Tax=Parascaris univalens TaxID=6257 RepID=A0A915BUF8_PARUN